MKLVYGKGVNDLPYKVQKYEMIDGLCKRAWICPYYDRWTGVVERCHSEKFKLRCPTYEDSAISDDWLKASLFKDWMETKDWSNKVLDKDILFPGNKLYSAETCVFVPKEINVAFSTNIKNLNRVLPTGVIYLEKEDKYLAQITTYGKLKKILRSRNLEEVILAYKSARESYIKELAVKHKNNIEQRVFEILMNYEERSGENYANIYK